MKTKFLYCLLILFNTQFALANNDDDDDDKIIGNFYEFNENINIIELKIEEDSFDIENMSLEEYEEGPTFISANGMILAKIGWVFKVTHKQKNLYVIQIINNDEYKDKFYGISINQLKNAAKKYEGDGPKTSFVSSAIMIPIKMRIGDGKNGANKKRYFDFEGNYNIGITAGFRDRVSKNGKHFLSYLGGINIGAAKITPETATITSETNASILTPFLGVMYEYNDFQIGAFGGWDHIGGKIGESWVYQGKFWLGFGLGYNIFTTK